MHMRSASIVLFLAVAGSVIVACGQEPATFNFNDITTQPFRLNTLETTPFGPAWADILVRPENFLFVPGRADRALLLLRAGSRDALLQRWCAPRTLKLHLL
jgi:hypothetical protein